MIPFSPFKYFSFNFCSFFLDFYFFVRENYGRNASISFHNFVSVSLYPAQGQLCFVPVHVGHRFMFSSILCYSLGSVYSAICIIKKETFMYLSQSTKASMLVVPSWCCGMHQCTDFCGYVLFFDSFVNFRFAFFDLT